MTQNISRVTNHLECGDHLVFILETETEIALKVMAQKKAKEVKRE